VFGGSVALPLLAQRRRKRRARRSQMGRPSLREGRPRLREESSPRPSRRERPNLLARR